MNKKSKYKPVKCPFCGSTKTRRLDIKILSPDRYKVKLLCTKCSKTFEATIKRYKKTIRREDGEIYMTAKGVKSRMELYIKRSKQFT